MLYYTVGQWRIFVFLFAAGALCGLWHGLFLILSKIFRAGFFLRALLDFAAALGIAVLLTTALLIACDGEIRVFSLLAALLGFLAYRNTVARGLRRLGRWLKPRACALARAIAKNRALQKIFR